jgi:hypothetical protein
MTTVSVTGSTTVQKWAICWLDVLVFAIVLTLGFSLWSFADRVMREAEANKEAKPVQETYEYERHVSVLQAELAMAQDDLKALDGKLIDTKTQVMRLRADLLPRPHNPRAKLLSPQRGKRIELLKAEHLARAYEAELPAKIKQIDSITHAAFQAKHSAELAYDKATKAFESAIRGKVLAIVGIGWLALILATCAACSLLRRGLGHGRASHVLVPGTTLMVMASLYYWFAK